LVRLTAFAALALYGVLRWGTLLSPAPTWRLLGLFALTVLLAGAGGALAARSKLAAALVAALALLAIFPLAGVPLAWVWQERIAVTADGIGQGLAALPSVLIPYLGINDWVRVVILLGAGVLLLDAAVVLAFTPRALGDLRRAGAALPLLALAVVPSTLARPASPYLQGLLLFALLAAFMWGERVRTGELVTACAIAGLAGIGAVVAAPGLDQHKPWLNYQALAGTFAPAHVETFDWTQSYGPLHWPRNGREILDVKAAHPDYWKAENLDVFNGTAWTQGILPGAADVPPPSLAAELKWTQTLKVTLRAIRTADVIGAGYTANGPTHVAQQVVQGYSPGTWTAAPDLAPGDSYQITAYSPHPTARELTATAGLRYPGQLSGYRSIMLPGRAISSTKPAVLFAPFHSGETVESVNGVFSSDGATTVMKSPYAGAFALAQKLASQSATPYAFAQSVKSYLSHGFTYNESPPTSPYPLESFLFRDRVGYCQQFSGAMALLLRMGGVPARVAAGFTTGTLDSTRGHYVVSDLDAHDWVEVWFPLYGWVKFDPTPTSAPARSGVPEPLLKNQSSKLAPTRVLKKPDPTPAPAQPVHTSTGGGSSVGALLAVMVLIAAAILALVLRARRRVGEQNDDERVAELERALRRCGRPIGDGVTLAALEHRFRSSPDAASYIRAIRLTRFAGLGEPPTPEQRRALRAQLRAGLGIVGSLRALWALPPRWAVWARRSVPRGRPARRLHSK
jgi:transglutaminase-like putative cysteine protease